MVTETYGITLKKERSKMDTYSAFAMGEAHRNGRTMVFDWRKAATLLKERGATDASAGLRGDWGYTGGSILEDGTPVEKDDTYTYLASTWATPEIDIEGHIEEFFV